MFRPRASAPEENPQEPRTFSPEEQAAYESGLDRVAEEKRRALADPGPGWKEWFLQSAAKWWMATLFLVVDSWIAALWFDPWNLYGLLPSILAALYLEYVAYAYLWHRPSEEGLGRRGTFRRTLLVPFEYGRWTPEADRVRAGGPLRPVGAEGAPDVRDFL